MRPRRAVLPGTLAPVLIGVLTLVLAACTAAAPPAAVYGASQTPLGGAQQLHGWDIAVGNLRVESGFALLDVDASVTDPAAPHARAEDLRFGLYGALAHPVEAPALQSCPDVGSPVSQPLAAETAQRLRGTLCIGPHRDPTQVRGVYAYSTADRMPGTTSAYAVPFPVGLAPTNETDTGLVLQTTSVEAFGADGGPIAPQAIGDDTAFAGQGFMLIGFDIVADGDRYRELAAARGGPLMVFVAPSLPRPGLSFGCDVYGSSVLVLPDAGRDAVAVTTSLCTQGDLTAALLYPTVSVAGTRAALWTRD